MKIKSKDFLSYVEGWLSTEVVDRGWLTLDSMKAALKNSLAMIDDHQDGIEAEMERKLAREVMYGEVMDEDARKRRIGNIFTINSVINAKNNK